MNRIEIALFIRPFIVFFIALELMTAIIFYKEYTNEVKNLEQQISYNMDTCNFNMDDNIYACSQYTIEFFNKEKELYSDDFLIKEMKKPDVIYKEKNLFYKYYSIPNYHLYLKISYDISSYEERINICKDNRINEFSMATILVLLVSILLSIYSLKPLADSLEMAEEFIKGILHDFNTPISSLMLNVKTLPKTKDSYEKIHRIEQSLNTILSLQENLKNYLKRNLQNSENIDLLNLVYERIEPLENLYPDIIFKIGNENLILFTDKSSISRILDNILVNASKYNKKNGEVRVSIKNRTIIISDTGGGIKNTKKIFNRFYKEHERGLGIGLHIVKKLSMELGIKIDVKSRLDEGTTFSITFPKNMIIKNID